MAIALDTSAKSAISGASKTLSYTIGSGSNRVLGVWIRTDGTASPTSVVYNSVALTKLYEISETYGRASFWYILESSLPSAGAHNIVINWAASRSGYLIASSFSGVSQAALGYTTAGGTGLTASVTRSFANNDSVAWQHVVFFEDASILPGTGQIELQDTLEGMESNYEVVASGSQTKTAVGNTSLWRTVLVELSPATSSPQTLTPSGIASSQAFGTLSVLRGNVNLLPSGIASGQAFGTSVIYKNKNLIPSGIASLQALGTAKINRKILGTGIVSAQAFGTCKVNRSISATGLNTKEGFGFLTVLRGPKFISTSGIASLQTFGNPSVLRGNVNVSTSGITSGQAFGTAKLNRKIIGTGIVSSQAFGTSVLSTRITFAANSIEPTEAFGLPSIAIGTASLQPVGIVSAQSFGTAKLNRNILCSGIESAQSFGTSVLYKNKNLYTSGIVSAQSFGTAKIVCKVLPSGIATQEAVSDPELLNIVVIIPFAITSVETFGNCEIDILFRPDSILSLENVPSPVIVRYVLPNSILSNENIGFAELDITYTISTSSIGSQEAFGTFRTLLNLDITDGIATEEAFGDPIAFYSLSPSGILSHEEFGIAALSAKKTLATSGIVSAQAFGTAKLNRNIFVNSCLSSENLGVPEIVSRNVCAPSGITTGEALGSHVLNLTVVTNSIATSVQLGVCSVVPGNRSITGISSISSDETFGTCSIEIGSAFVITSGIQSEETFYPIRTIAGNYSILTSTIESSEVFGFSVIELRTNIYTNSIQPQENFGYSTFTFGDIIYPDGLVSSENFGSSNIIFNQKIEIYDGIYSEENFGVLKVIRSLRNKLQTLMDKDLDNVFFNNKEFSESITFFASPAFTVNGIFDNEYVSVNTLGDVDIQSTQPTIWVPTKVFKKKPEKGMRVIVSGVRYRVMTSEPDGTGLTVMRLNHE